MSADLIRAHPFYPRHPRSIPFEKIMEQTRSQNRKSMSSTIKAANLFAAAQAAPPAALIEEY